MLFSRFLFIFRHPLPDHPPFPSRSQDEQPNRGGGENRGDFLQENQRATRTVWPSSPDRDGGQTGRGPGEADEQQGGAPVQEDHRVPDRSDSELQQHELAQVHQPATAILIERRPSIILTKVRPSS